MGRRRVEIEVIFLDVLAVVPLAVRQPEQALLEDRVPAVPEGQGEAEALLVVGDPRQAILAPAIGPGTRLIMGEEVPGVSRIAVVFADRPPLALAQVRSPLPPRRALPGLGQALLFGIRSGLGHVTSSLDALRRDSPAALRGRPGVQTLSQNSSPRRR